jgi:hypothetical protein
MKNFLPVMELKVCVEWHKTAFEGQAFLQMDHTSTALPQFIIGGHICEE